jgi:O-antigen/teichoic acid export membrane protein
MSIAYGGIVAFLFRGLNLVVALSTVLLTSRQLSRGEYGTFVLGLTVIGIVSAATGGLTAATAYQVSNKRRAPAAALLNGGSLGVTLGLAAVLVGILGTQVFTGEANRVSAAVGAAAAAVIVNSVVAGVFLGRGSLIRYNFALVVPPSFSLLAIAALFVATGHKSPEGALAMLAAGQWAAVAALVLTGGGGFVGGWTFDKQLTKHIARFAFLAGAASAISYLNYRADLFVVRHFEGKDGVATYSLAVYIAESVWQVSGSLALASYQRVGALSRHEAAALTTRVMRHTVVLLAVICGLLFLTAGLIESILFGDKYPGVASALRFILPGVLLYGLAQSYSAFYTQQRGLPWVAALVAGMGLAVDLILAIVLVPRMGVDGAALASALAYSSAILAGLISFVRGEHLRPGEVFRFGRADVEDYRTLVGRLRAAIAREATPPA